MTKYIVFALILMIAPAHAAGLQIGDKAPDFALTNADGNERTLSTLLKNGPVILTFYRGSWCPYCNDQLYAYQENLDEIEGAGAQLIAISPEKPTSMVDQVLIKDLEFEVLSDAGNEVIRKYGLVWFADKKTLEKTSRYVEQKTGETLAERNGLESAELPIPGTFVINTDGIVTYAFVDEDYKKRAPIKDVLKALADINSRGAEVK